MNNNSECNNVIIVTMVRTPYFAWRYFGDHGLKAGNVTELFVPENVGLNSYAGLENHVEEFVSMLRSPLYDSDDNSWSEELANRPVAIA